MDQAELERRLRAVPLVCDVHTEPCGCQEGYKPDYPALAATVWERVKDRDALGLEVEQLESLADEIERERDALKTENTRLAGERDRLWNGMVELIAAAHEERTNRVVFHTPDESTCPNAICRAITKARALIAALAPPVAEGEKHDD